MKYFLALFFFIPLFVFGQTSDLLLLTTFIQPGGYYRVKIDGNLMPLTNKFKLKKGNHNIAIWAPNYSVFKKKINISTPVYIKQKLVPTEELIAYKKASENYKNLNTQMKIGLWGAGIMLAGIAINYTIIGAKKIELVKAQNRVDFNIIGYNQQNLNEAKSSYNMLRNVQYVFEGVAISAITYTVFKYLKNRKIIVPKLSEDKIFLLSDIGFIYSPIDKNMHFNLAINF